MTTPKTDYTTFALPADDGRIWWKLEDAFKLAAGYLPLRDDTQNLVPKLVAPTQRTKANERDLLAAFHANHFGLTVPPTVGNDENNDASLVDAALFLNWLSQYIAHSQANIRVPVELVRAVRDAHKEHSASDEDGSAHQAAHSRAWDLWIELERVRAEIAEYENLRPLTISEKALKEDKLRALKERERAIDVQQLSASDVFDPSIESSRTKQPPGKQAWQEDEILRAIRDLDHEPTAIPKYESGKPGVKASVRSLVSKRHPRFAEGTVFDKAWQRLRDSKQIIEKSDNPSPKLGDR